jgi:hypothetical protein
VAPGQKLAGNANNRPGYSRRFGVAAVIRRLGDCMLSPVAMAVMKSPGPAMALLPSPVTVAVRISTRPT